MDDRQTTLMDIFKVKSGELNILKFKDHQGAVIEGSLTNSNFIKPLLKLKKSYFNYDKKTFSSSASTSYLYKHITNNTVYKLTPTEVTTEVQLSSFVSSQL